MSIEDFNVDSTQHSDRVLVLTKDATTRDKIGHILSKRSVQWKPAESLPQALDMATQELFDLIIVQAEATEQTATDLMTSLRGEPSFKRSSLLILHPEPGTQDSRQSSLYGTSAQVLKLPFEPPELFVKVSTQLRMRKLNKSQAAFDAKIQNQNAELRDLTNRFRHELKEAQSIQQSLLPNQLPSDSRCHLSYRFLPLEAVAGDLFDMWRIDVDIIGLFVGDVTGHGLPAAFIGAMTKMALAYGSQPDPGKLLTDMNKGIFPHLPDGRFVTVFAATYNAATGVLRTARGGHPPGFLFRKETNEVQLIQPRGMPLGFIPDTNYETFEATLLPGDKLILITDGLSESTNMNGEMFGTSLCSDVIKKHAELPIAELLPAILLAQQEFCGERVLKDDVTLMGLERMTV